MWHAAVTLADPLPKQVLQYLRIQRLDESDLAVIRHIGATCGKIDDSNEVKALQSLISSIGSIMDSFGVQLGKVEEQFAEGIYSLRGSAREAAHISLGEQRVLWLATTRAEDLLAAVETRE